MLPWKQSYLSAQRNSPVAARAACQSRANTRPPDHPTLHCTALQSTTGYAQVHTLPHTQSQIQGHLLLAPEPRSDRQESPASLLTTPSDGDDNNDIPCLAAERDACGHVCVLVHSDPMVDQVAQTRRALVCGESSVFNTLALVMIVPRGVCPVRITAAATDAARG